MGGRLYIDVRMAKNFEQFVAEHANNQFNLPASPDAVKEKTKEKYSKNLVHIIGAYGSAKKRLQGGMYAPGEKKALEDTVATLGSEMGRAYMRAFGVARIDPEYRQRLEADRKLLQAIVGVNEANRAFSGFEGEVIMGSRLMTTPGGVLYYATTDEDTHNGTDFWLNVDGNLLALQIKATKLKDPNQNKLLYPVGTPQERAVFIGEMRSLIDETGPVEFDRKINDYMRASEKIALSADTLYSNTRAVMGIHATNGTELSDRGVDAGAVARSLALRS